MGVDFRRAVTKPVRDASPCVSWQRRITDRVLFKSECEDNTVMDSMALAGQATDRIA